jgi:hypothetical protein
MIYVLIVSFFLFLSLLASLFVNIYQAKLHSKEKEDLFIRLASKSLDEAEFYRKEYPKRVEERMKAMEEERKNPLSAEDLKKKAVAGSF